MDNLTERGTNLVLSVPESGRTFSGSISFESGSLEWGSLTAAVSAHRCDSEYAHPYCSVCGHYQPDDLELAFRSPLTLKHDNQTSFSIVHTNSVGETHTNGVIEIRYKNILIITVKDRLKELLSPFTYHKMLRLISYCILF